MEEALDKKKDFSNTFGVSDIDFAQQTATVGLILETGTDLSGPWPFLWIHEPYLVRNCHKNWIISFFYVFSTLLCLGLAH